MDEVPVMAEERTHVISGCERAYNHQSNENNSIDRQEFTLEKEFSTSRR